MDGRFKTLRGTGGKDWPLYKAVDEAANTILAVEDEVELAKCSAKALLAALEDLGSTKCTECSGYGHVSKDCMTYVRVQELTLGFPGMKSLVSRARNSIYQGAQGKKLKFKRRRF